MKRYVYDRERKVMVESVVALAKQTPKLKPVPYDPIADLKPLKSTKSIFSKIRLRQWAELQRTSRF